MCLFNLISMTCTILNSLVISGADPHLGYVLVQDVVKGIQSQKVIANWIENNQETNRDTVSANVDERT